MNICIGITHVPGRETSSRRTNIDCRCHTLERTWWGRAGRNQGPSRPTWRRQGQDVLFGKPGHPPESGLPLLRSLEAPAYFGDVRIQTKPSPAIMLHASAPPPSDTERYQPQAEGLDRSTASCAGRDRPTPKMRPSVVAARKTGHPFRL